MKKSIFSIKDLVIQAMIAAIYALLVYLTPIFSFGAIQFRVAELLIILVLFNKKYIIGLTIGCLIANIISPNMLVLDLVFGTLATLISVVLVYFTRKIKPLALLFPSIVNGIIIGFVIHFSLGLPVSEIWTLLATMGTVFIGEFVITYVIGLPLSYVLEKNKNFKSIIE